MGTKAKRQRAAIREILAAQRKAEEGKPKNAMEAYIASIPDEDQREQFRKGVKHGREAMYRLKSAGCDLTDDVDVFGNIKHVVDQPENEFVDLYYEGPVPSGLPKVPWILNIKTPKVPDISKAMGKTLPCGSWPQFISALVAYGDKEARDDIRWVLEEVHRIKPIEDEELEAARKMVSMARDRYIETTKGSHQTKPLATGSSSVFFPRVSPLRSGI